MSEKERELEDRLWNGEDAVTPIIAFIDRQVSIQWIDRTGAIQREERVAYSQPAPPSREAEIAAQGNRSRQIAVDLTDSLPGLLARFPVARVNDDLFEWIYSQCLELEADALTRGRRQAEYGLRQSDGEAEIAARLARAAEKWGDYDGDAEADLRYLLAQLQQARQERMKLESEIMTVWKGDTLHEDAHGNLLGIATEMAKRRDNEGVLLRSMSDRLTGGNASTWDEILHAAETAIAAALAAQQAETEAIAAELEAASAFTPMRPVQGVGAEDLVAWARRVRALSPTTASKETV